MDGDWETIKAKPKQAKAPKAQEHKVQYGGKKSNGTLTAGPIKQKNYGGSSNQYESMNNQASQIADFDFHVDDESYDKIKFEQVSQICAKQIREARMAKNMTQEKLAHAIGVKTITIVEIENATAQFKGGHINNIEKALGVKIERGRNKK